MGRRGRGITRNAPETAIKAESEAFSSCGAKGIRTPDLLGAIRIAAEQIITPYSIVALDLTASLLVRSGRV